MKLMKQEKQQEIALMRYGAIAPIIAGLDERYPSKTAFYTEISAKGLMGPDGKLHHYAPATIEKWYLDYQNHGFEGLVPKGRSLIFRLENSTGSRLCSVTHKRSIRALACGV